MLRRRGGDSDLSQGADAATDALLSAPPALRAKRSSVVAGARRWVRLRAAAVDQALGPVGILLLASACVIVSAACGVASVRYVLQRAHDLPAPVVCPLAPNTPYTPLCCNRREFASPEPDPVSRCSGKGVECCDRPILDWPDHLEGGAVYTQHDWDQMLSFVLDTDEKTMMKEHKWTPQQFLDQLRLAASAYPSRDLLREQPRYQRCAVVGSSGRLNLAPHGDEINAADAVFRFNFSPTLGHEAAVGNRTDYRHVHIGWYWWLLARPTHWLHDEESFRVTSMRVPRYNNLIDYEQFVSDYAGGDANATMMLSWKLEAWLRCWMQRRDGKSANLSTGLFGLYWASLLCHEVDLYGYGFLDPSHCPHYYDGGPKSGLGPSGDCNKKHDEMKTGKITKHDIDQELATILMLDKATPCVRWHY